MNHRLFKILVISTFTTLSFMLSFNSKIIMAQKSGDSSGKQATQSEVNEGLDEAKNTISMLTRKVYSQSLFSPQDNEKLVDLKIKLYQIWEKNPTNRELAEPMYNTAVLLQKRELFEEALEILNIVSESFPPSEEMDEESGMVIDYSSKAQSLIKKIQKEQEE